MRKLLLSTLIGSLLIPTFATAASTDEGAAVPVQLPVIVGESELAAQENHKELYEAQSLKIKQEQQLKKERSEFKGDRSEFKGAKKGDRMKHISPEQKAEFFDQKIEHMEKRLLSQIAQLEELKEMSLEEKEEWFKNHHKKMKKGDRDFDKKGKKGKKDFDKKGKKGDRDFDKGEMKKGKDSRRMEKEDRPMRPELDNRMPPEVDQPMAPPLEDQDPV